MPINLDEKKLTSESAYAAELETEIVDKAKPEITIYLLKNQLVEAAIINHNLMRVIKLLVWKLNVERANTRIQTEMVKVLQKNVSSLEDFISKSTAKRQAMKEKIEKFDLKISQLKQQLDMRQGFPLTFGTSSSIKPRLRMPLSKRLILRKYADFSSRHSNVNPAFTTNRFCSPQRRVSHNDIGFVRAFENGFRMLRKEDEDYFQISEIKEEDPTGKFVNGTESKPTPINDNSALQMQYESVELNKDEFAQYEMDLKEARMEMTWHKTLSDFLMAELVKTREQANTYRNQASEIKSSAEQAVQDENRNWQIITKSLKVFL